MFKTILFSAIMIFCNTINLAHSTANAKHGDGSYNNPHIKSIVAIDQAQHSENTQVFSAEKVVMLSGKQQTTGTRAPNFKVVDAQFNPVQLSDFNGQTLLINTVPSIDTGDCSLRTKQFNETVLKLPAQVILLTISADLPFAQKRFCPDQKVAQMQLLSDSVWRDFGLKYGLLIKDLGLLTRAVLIIDQQGIIRYQQLVKQLSQLPDYDQALTSLQAILDSPNSKNR